MVTRHSCAFKKLLEVHFTFIYALLRVLHASMGRFMMQWSAADNSAAWQRPVACDFMR